MRVNLLIEITLFTQCKSNTDCPKRYDHHLAINVKHKWRHQESHYSCASVEGSSTSRLAGSVVWEESSREGSNTGSTCRASEESGGVHTPYDRGGG